jgi:hypothetical protein
MASPVGIVPAPARAVKAPERRFGAAAGGPTTPAAPAVLE